LCCRGAAHQLSSGVSQGMGGCSGAAPQLWNGVSARWAAAPCPGLPLLLPLLGQECSGPGWVGRAGPGHQEVFLSWMGRGRGQRLLPFDHTSRAMGSRLGGDSGTVGDAGGRDQNSKCSSGRISCQQRAGLQTWSINKRRPQHTSTVLAPAFSSGLKLWGTRARECASVCRQQVRLGRAPWQQRAGPQARLHGRRAPPQRTMPPPPQPLACARSPSPWRGCGGAGASRRRWCDRRRCRLTAQSWWRPTRTAASRAMTAWQGCGAGRLRAARIWCCLWRPSEPGAVGQAAGWEGRRTGGGQAGVSAGWHLLFVLACLWFPCFIFSFLSITYWAQLVWNRCPSFPNLGLPKALCHSCVLSRMETQRQGKAWPGLESVMNCREFRRHYLVH
jgi:hypothetical protein